MAIDAATVRKVAKLARIAEPEERLEPLARELSAILDWIEQLGEVDTDEVEPMTTAVAATLPMREDVVTEIPAGKTNQFTLMIDYFASCIQQNKDVHTPGEEGLQDQRIMDAIYESARSGRVVKLKPLAGKTRGPEPESAD